MQSKVIAKVHFECVCVCVCVWGFYILSVCFFSVSVISRKISLILCRMWIECRQINDTKRKATQTHAYNTQMNKPQMDFRINWNIEYVIECNLIKIMIWNHGGKLRMWFLFSFCVFICCRKNVRFLFTIFYVAIQMKCGKHNNSNSNKNLCSTK